MVQVNNLITLIKNSFLVSKKYLEISWSLYNASVLKILLKVGFISKYVIFKNSSGRKKILVYLTYYIDEFRKKNPSMSDIKLISKSSRRIYIKAEDIFHDNHTISFIGSSKGILTNLEAKNLNIGGEFILKIW